MKLARITPFGLAEIRRIVGETRTLPTTDLVTEHWWSEHESGIAIKSLLDVAATWSPPSAEQDAHHAEQVHRSLKFPRRVAADRMIWPWLAAIPMREYTLARWKGPKPWNVERVDSGIDKNTLGRLWWSAEIARVDRPREVCGALRLPPTDDPYFFLKELFSTADLQQGITYRHELTDRTKLVALLAFLRHNPMTTLEQRDVIRDARLLFSTVLLDALDADSPVGGYAVDPDRCTAALRLLERNLTSATTQQPDQSGEGSGGATPAGAREKSPGFISRLFGRKPRPKGTNR